MNQQYLVKAWGETEYPDVAIVDTLQEARDMVCLFVYGESWRSIPKVERDELLKDLEDKNLSTVVSLERHFEIGGVCVGKAIRSLSYKQKQVERQSELWHNLRLLAGFVQNGSDVTVKMSQDDATRTSHLNVGKRSYYGDSFEECVDKAMKDYVE